MNMSKKVVCFGEVLWDVLPTGKIAGGAPMNMAIRLQSLGIDTQIISRTGMDDSGTALKNIIAQHQVTTALVQEDEHIATGEVLVKLDALGIATYNIVYPSAWDKIEIADANRSAVQYADAFVFGSLACRDAVSRQTLLELLSIAQYKIFDVNLRPPFYDIAFIELLMKQADFIKLNDEELIIIATALGSKSTVIETNIQFIAGRTGAKTICITRGKDGAVLFAENKCWSHPGFTVKVEDTIGSGDSFLAALISQILSGKEYAKAVEYACAVGALVAMHKGANPVLKEEDIKQLINK